MRISMYAIHDALLGYSMPVLRDNDSVASRAFEFDINRENSPYKTHPEHFSLYKIGEYNTENANMESCPPEFICCANELIEKE